MKIKIIIILIVNEELNITMLANNTLQNISNNKQHIKLTVECFKKISMNSNSKNGRLTKQYYIEMERIVKNFCNLELQRLKK